MNSKIKLFSILGLALSIQSAGLKDDTITKEDGTYIINTTELGKNIEGYNGPTPLKIYIKKNKVVKIEALKNQETPKYYARVKKALFEKWNNLKVSEAQKLQVDGVTGATYTSEAVIKNVQAGLDYYKKHK
jgi:electron transport complex protein RnfG